jgi:hypothetical protein
MYLTPLVCLSEFLVHFAGPLFRDVISETKRLVEATEAAGADRAMSSSTLHISIHGGHDVTLLGIRFALNAVVDDAYGMCLIALDADATGVSSSFI